MTTPRNRLLSPEKHQELADSITVALLLTPWESVAKVAPTDSVRKARTVMASERYDQLGVEDSNRSGLIRGSAIEEAHEDAPILSAVEWSANKAGLSTNTGLMQALKQLSEVPSTLVYDGEKVAGLVHRSDFNKQAVRTYFYLWLSAIEMGLAELVRRRFPDDQLWLGRLSQHKQAWVLGNVELARRKGVDLHAVEYLDLSDLSEIVENSQKVLVVPLWDELGLGSSSAWKRISGPLVDLRHSVMHPVRTLIWDAASAKRLVKRDSKVLDLVAAVRTALELSHSRADS